MISRPRFAHALVAFVALVACEDSAWADVSRSPSAAETELVRRIEAILAERHVAGAGLALVGPDGSRFATGFGFADVGKGRAATANTLFRVASLSKILVSLSILSLVREGLFSLETPVRELVPEVEFENPWESTAPVRVSHLLENTTGWDDLRPREFAHDAEASLPMANVLAFDPRSRTSRFRPGTYASYCNSGPTVAAAIVEKVTGKSYEVFVSERFFGPLGMPTATFAEPSGADGARATLYAPDGRTALPRRNLLFRASAGLDASATEMGNLLWFLVSRGRIGAAPLLPTSALDRMETPTTTAGARLGLVSGYGLASQALQAEGFVWRGHRGGFAGASADLFYVRELGVGYFLALSGDDDRAFISIGNLVRAHLVSGAVRSAPPAPSVGEPIGLAPGFYEVANPRYERSRFFRALVDLAYVNESKEGVVVHARAGHPLGGSAGAFVRVRGPLLRREDEAVPSLAVLGLRPDEGRDAPTLETPEIALRRVPTVSAFLRLASLALLSAMLLSAVPVGLVDLVRIARRQGRALEGIPASLAGAPLVAIAALVGGLAVAGRSDMVALGRVSPSSVAVFLSTLVFAAAAVTSAYQTLRLPKEATGRARRAHFAVVSAGLVGATAYLAYWGIVGIRTWD